MSALGAAIEAGDVEGVKALLLTLAEPARRKLAKEAAAAQKRFWAGASVEVRKGVWQWRYEGTEQQREAASYAVFGTCSASELREMSRRRGVLVKAADFWRELKPSFLPQAAELVTEGGSCWGLARALVREGLSARPTTDGYIRAFLASGAHTRQRGTSKPLVEAILEDPALLEYEIWRLFEVEGGGEDSFAAHDKYSAGTTPWANAFLDLVAGGHLPRARVLDATLSALERDFSQFRASWFSQLHETLAPSVDERRERIEVYLRLLASPIAPTVSFAMSAIKLVDAAAPLCSEQVLPYATRLLAAGKKGAALGLLALLAKIARREPSAAPALARAVAVALGHESSDVQKVALDLLDRLRPSLDADAVAHVAAQAGSVAASLRGRLDAWRSGTGETAATSAVGEATSERVADPLPAMDPPIDSLDELIDLTARALEAPDDPWLLERVLDGISRLCAERPTDFALRTAPVARRAKAILKRRGETIAGALAKVVIAWIEGRVVETPNLVEPPTLEGFLVARLLELSARVSRGEARPLLSPPTGRAGFVDGAALRERLAALPEKSAIDPLDAIVALLRLREADLAATSADPALRRLDAFRRPVPDPEPTFAVAARTLLVNSHTFDVLVVGEPEREGAAAPPLDDPPAILATVRWSGKSAGREKLALRWAATLMPGASELFFADGARRLGNNLDGSEADWGTAAYLEPLRELHTAMGPMATLLLVLGLSAKEPGEHALATDAAIAAFEQGRLDGPTLGATLAQLHPTGWLKTKRWTRMLGVVAQASPVCVGEVRRALQATLRGDPARAPRDEGALVDLLCELLAESGGVVDDPQARAYLAASRHQRRLKGDVLGRR